MSRIRASRSRSLVVYSLVVAMLLPSMTAALAQQESTGAPTGGPIRSQATLSMLVFPLRDETDARGDLDRIVTQALARALEQVGAFDAQVFSMNSPSAVRQVDEGVLRTEDVAAPYEAAAALAVGHALGVDIVLVGTVLERTVDEDTNVVSLTISGNTYEVAANVDPETGTPKAELEPFRPLFAVTGSSIERKIPHRGPATDLDKEAADDAGKKVAARMADVPQMPQTEKKKTFWKKWGKVLLVALVATGFALATNDEGGNPTDTAPPPTNPILSVENGVVRVSWGPPANPPRPILFYRVQRSLNNGPRVVVDDTAPVVFSVIDPVPQTGNLVQYFIQATYQGNIQSALAPSGVIVVP
jgi:hypothetical protein